MTLTLRPLPVAIVLMTLLAGVKTVGLVEAVGIGAPAQANTPPHEAHAEETKPKPSAVEAKPVAAVPAQPAAPAEPPISGAERTALQDLRERSKQLDARAAQLDDREAILSAAEQRMTERIKQLTALQGKLEQLDSLRHEREEANWKGLVKTYEAMRPRDAAAIFNDLDNTIVVQVLDRMKENKAAAILSAMSTERARSVTIQLAQWRNQSSAAPRLDTASVKQP